MKTQPVQNIEQPKQTRERFIEELFDLKKKDNFLLGKEAREKTIAGVEKGFKILKGSYGASGSNVKRRVDLYPFHEATNDGKKILEGVKLACPYEMMSLNTMKEVADKCDKESGDGRKTAAIVYAATILEGNKVKEDSMEIKRSLEACIPVIKESLLTQSKGITEHEVGKIATIASENPKLGAIFQEIYEKIGSDGIIELDNSGIPETSYEITEGVKLLNCGFMYPYMAKADKGRKAEFNNPHVLITRQKIMSMSQLDPIFKVLSKQGINELVIFCDEIELQVSQILAMLSEQGVETPEGATFMFKTLVIKAPILWKDWLFEDFAKITGATIIDPGAGTTLKSLRAEYLGRCDKIVTSKNETIVLGTKDISDHVKVLEDLNTDDAKIRASRLKTKTAILKLGANSESELSHLRGKALDARNSSWLAMQGGVVIGGGRALSKCIKDLPDTVGGNILKKALQYPMDIIIENSGETKLGPDILDATTVVVNSMTNAISVAATELSIKVLEI